MLFILLLVREHLKIHSHSCIGSLACIVVYHIMLQKMKDRLAQEEVLQNFISDKIKKHEETYNEHNIRDFVDHYIREKRAGTEHGRFSG